MTVDRRAFDPFAPAPPHDESPKPKAKRKSKPKETPMQFPRNRLLSAGASDAEVTQLEAEHDAASPEAQESRIRHLEKIAEGDIVEWLEDLRKAGHFGEPAKTPEAAEAAETPADEVPETVTPEPEVTKPEATKPKRKPKATEEPVE